MLSFYNYKLHSSVETSSFFSFICCDELSLSEAFSFQSLRANLIFDEVIQHCLSSFLTQGKIVFIVSDMIGMPRNLNVYSRIFLEQFDQTIQFFKGLIFEVCAGRFEKYIV